MILIITYITLPILIAVPMYLAYRNKKMLKFLHDIIDLCAKWDDKHTKEIISGKEKSSFIWFYDEFFSYDRILYSLKPLKLESFASKEDIEKLMS